jgi:hypothetical protein
MSKNLKIIIGVVIFSAFAAAAYFLLPKGSKLTAEGEKQAADICYLYKYDMANPNIHGGTFDKGYYEQRWKTFEQTHGPTGATSLDEFCAKR